MRSALKALVAHKISTYLHYRSYIFLWMLSGLVPLLIMLLWAAAFGSSLSSALMSSVYAYYSVSFVIKQITTTWVADDLARQIQSGELSMRIVQPIYVWVDHVAGHIGGGVIRLLPSLLVGGLVLFSTHSAAALKWSSLPLFLLSLTLGWAVSFTLAWIIGILSFWISEIKSINGIVSLLSFSLGGIMAPIAFLPSGVKAISELTPFSSIVAIPVGILVPEMATSAPLLAIFKQIFWLVVLILVAFFLWHRGSNAYEGNEG